MCKYVRRFKILTPSFEGIVDTDDVSAVSIIVKKFRNYQIFI